jgi:hypothetical protein
MAVNDEIVLRGAATPLELQFRGTVSRSHGGDVSVRVESGRSSKLGVLGIGESDGEFTKERHILNT